MAFSEIYLAANDAVFQGRCMAAAWQTAQHVIAGDNGYDVSAPSKDFAYSLLRDQTRITPKQVAMQVLRNATIAANIAGSTDSDIDWQTNQVWLDLVSIG
jgi:hypothetical protein